jgi:uncharacterized membrane protein YesL
MFRGIFKADSWLWKPFGWLADVLILSGLWLLCSLPVVTIGGATAALYDAVVHGFRRHESDYLYRFFGTFKAEWKHGIPPTLFWGGLLTALFLGYRWFTGQASGDAAVMAAYALLVVLCIPVGIACWVFPVLSRFELGFGLLCANSAKLALAHLPGTFAMALATGACVWVTGYLLFLPLLFLPALLTLFWSLFTEPVFKRYETEAEAPGAPGEDEAPGEDD